MLSLEFSSGIQNFHQVNKFWTRLSENIKKCIKKSICSQNFNSMVRIMTGS